jgi:exodeoxyribonuclease-3
MKIVSWNVNGIRAIMGKDFKQSVEQMQADILCLQETKAQDDQVSEALKDFSAYHLFCNSAVRKGYSGTAVLSKIKPINVSFDIGVEEHDQEGRVITVEYPTFFLVNTYVPNSGSELDRLPYRKTWDAALLSYLQKLEKVKPVLLCGDLNVAHRDIDLANPKPNYNKSAGYTQDEIDGMDNFHKANFVDTFRFFHPDTVKYTWWSYRAGARARNVGWRIDYFLASKAMNPMVKSAAIHNEFMGSDHCPVSVVIQ